MTREEIVETAAAAGTHEERLGLLRECVQAATLRSLHESKAFMSLALTGAAALRFALGSPEFAADLEFALVDKREYKPERWLFAAKRRLSFMGLDASVAFARRTAVHSGWIRVPSLLVEAGLADHEVQPLGFRILVDISQDAGRACGVKLAEVAGERFALRYIARPDGTGGGGLQQMRQMRYSTENS